MLICNRLVRARHPSLACIGIVKSTSRFRHAYTALLSLRCPLWFLSSHAPTFMPPPNCPLRVLRVPGASRGKRKPRSSGSTARYGRGARTLTFLARVHPENLYVAPWQPRHGCNAGRVLWQVSQGLQGAQVDVQVPEATVGVSAAAVGRSHRRGRHTAATSRITLG